MTSYVITYRLVKGSPITEAEYDGSLHNLDDRVTVNEASTASIVVPVDFEINTAGHLDVIMSNSTVIDAGAIPVAESFAQSYKGAWAPLTHYFENDLFKAPTSNWLGAVLIDHVSASSFDWGANDGMGHNFYAVAVPISPAPTTVTLISPAHTLTLDDINTYIRSTSVDTAGAVLITIPTDTAVPFPIDSEVNFCQRGDSITFTPAGGVTLNYPEDCNPITAIPGAVVTLRKVNTNEWDLFGRLQHPGVVTNLIRQPNSATLSLSGSPPRLFKSLVPGSGVLALARGTPIRTP
jgi:hypothetical protein